MTASRRSRRPKPSEEVPFPVTPFLDMAFQLLAFFILTFKAPSRETRIDLDLPTAAATLPTAARGRVAVASLSDPDLENDLLIRVRASDDGEIAAIDLGESSLSGVDDLESRLRRYVALLAGKPLRVRLDAPDRLRFGGAAKILGACEAAGVGSIRMVEPGASRR